MSHQYEEVSQSQSTIYDAPYERQFQHNIEQKLSSANPTVGQRLALAIASLFLMLVVSIIALSIMIANINFYLNGFFITLLFVILILCFLSTVVINVVFNRRR
jgi:ABC-type multidrug transport system permease subunit